MKSTKKENQSKKKKLKTVNQLKTAFQASLSVTSIAGIFTKEKMPHEYIYKLAILELSKGVDADLNYIDKLITGFTEIHKSMTEPDWASGSGSINTTLELLKKTRLKNQCGILSIGEEVIFKPKYKYCYRSGDEIIHSNIPPPPPPPRTVCKDTPKMIYINFAMQCTRCYNIFMAKQKVKTYFKNKHKVKKCPHCGEMVTRTFNFHNKCQ